MYVVYTTVEEYSASQGRQQIKDKPNAQTRIRVEVGGAYTSW
jgi:hypothetical protein